MKSVHYGWLIFLATGTAATTQAPAQYPVKSVRLIVPFPPGGGADAFGRIVGSPLSEALGRPVVVENRSGAGGNIGAEIAAKSPPDGHTLLLSNVAHAFNVTLYSKLNYDLIRDFAPISLTATTPNILVVHPSVPVKSVKDLIALGGSRPGQLDYVSGGSGSPAHLAAVLFISMSGVKMNHIPYKGGAPSVIALIGGEAPLGFPTMPTVIQHVRSGKLRGIAVSSVRRSIFTPDLPTISEAGVTGYEAATWYGLLAPTGTPNEVISRLYAESVKALKRPDVKERLEAAGLEPVGTRPEQLGAHIRSEIAKWATVVKTSGAHAD
jgi:tripartite-type tricarboxylate transporter receptor subunit TctC